MRRVIFNQKGGVGKSSIASNLAAISAHKGFSTLLVDLDPQCNSSHYLLGEAVNEVEQDVMGFYEQTLKPGKSKQQFTDFIITTPFENLSLVASHPSLGELHGKLEAKHKIYKLRDELSKLEQFDHIYIDTPPAFNFYTLSALVASEGCLIPFDCDEFSRQALYALLENLQETVEDHNEDLELEGIVINQYQARASLPKKMVEQLKAEGLPVKENMLSSSVKMRESHQANKPLIHFAPKHKLTMEMVELFGELQK